jgi:Na+/proline symporter
VPDASWIDVGIIACYLAAMIGVAVWSAKKVKNLGDYALAGRSLGYPVMIGTLIGATIGAASTFGKAGKAYEVGIIFFIVPLGYNAGLLLFGFFSSRKGTAARAWK